MRYLLTAFMILVTISGIRAQTLGKVYTNRIDSIRDAKNVRFSNPDDTPLKASDISSFRGLKYFKVNESFRLNATLVELQEKDTFEMPTSTERLPIYIRFGIIHFEIEGVAYQLEAYQNLSLLDREGYEDYLFIPFRDETCGKQSYGAGRFLDMHTGPGEIILDFNLAYNPYCAYNERYSCPIPPVANWLEIPIRAGEKIYAKH